MSAKNQQLNYWAQKRKNLHFSEGRWSAEEHRQFLRGIEKYGKNYKMVKTLIPTRNITQIRTHGQKYFQKVAKSDGRGRVAMRCNGDKGGKIYVATTEAENSKSGTLVRKVIHRSKTYDKPETPDKPETKTASIIHTNKRSSLDSPFINAELNDTDLAPVAHSRSEESTLNDPNDDVSTLELSELGRQSDEEDCESIDEYTSEWVDFPRVLFNLIQNEDDDVIKFHPDGGEILVGDETRLAEILSRYFEDDTLKTFKTQIRQCGFTIKFTSPPISKKRRGEQMAAYVNSYGQTQQEEQLNKQRPVPLFEAAVLVEGKRKRAPSVKVRAFDGEQSPPKKHSNQLKPGRPKIEGAIGQFDSRHGPRLPINQIARQESAYVPQHQGSLNSSFRKGKQEKETSPLNVPLFEQDLVIEGKRNRAQSKST